MENDKPDSLRYPIGKFEMPDPLGQEQLEMWIHELEVMPERYRELTAGLKAYQLDTPYRPGGWTVRQVVHHVADSHHNSYIRFKWALTEEDPVIKPYDEKAWAGLFDSQTAPIHISLDHLGAVHAKLVYLLKGLSPDQLKRRFIHPDGNLSTTLEENIGRYVWHGNHHYAHIENLLLREGWK